MLDALGFTGAQDEPVAALSTGNVQKVGLAQALAVVDGLVVLDEPWTALDGDAAHALSALLAERTASTLVIADHTGRAAALPGATTHRLADGRLSPLGVAPSRVAQGDSRVDPDAAPPWTVIEVVCRDRAVPPPAAERAHWNGVVLVVVVAARDVDAWLRAALASGCSVLSVRRTTEPDR